MGIRKEFYDGLRQDYAEQGERSYLYRYFQSHPRKRRGAGETGAPDDTHIRRDIQTFLYDAGRKKDQSLTMLEEFCARQGVTTLLTGGEAEQDRDSVEELERFCRAQMQRRGKHVGQMLVPLKIDPLTGAGLYLAGADYLESQGFPVRGSCCYLCLWTDELMLYRDEDEDGEGDYLWSLGFIEREDIAEQYGYPSLTEALTWFDRLTALKGKAHRSFTDTNGPAPEGCPASLLRYFEPAPGERGEKERRREALISRGQESFRRDGAKPAR